MSIRFSLRADASGGVVTKRRGVLAGSKLLTKQGSLLADASLAANSLVGEVGARISERRSLTIEELDFRLFPRSADRGLIEARSRLPIDCDRVADFRDQLIAASLKLCQTSWQIRSIGDDHFRDQLIAASLKHEGSALHGAVRPLISAIS